MQADSVRVWDALPGPTADSSSDPRSFLHAHGTGGFLRGLKVLGKAVLALVALLIVAIVAVTEFPDQLRAILPGKLAQLLPPPLPKRAPLKAAYWLDQNWLTEDRHWFHHVTQGAATFPVPYDWFVALEQPNLSLFGGPGMFADSAYLERFGFIPSPRSIHTDAATLRRYGYSPAPDAKTEPARPSAPVCRRRQEKIQMACPSASPGSMPSISQPAPATPVGSA